MNCLRCGQPMRRTEKESSSGGAIREYVCDLCGYRDWEDAGVAFLHAPSHAAGVPGEEADQIPQLPHSSLWNRLLARFGG